MDHKNEIEQTLESLDNLEPVNAPLSFFDSIQERVEDNYSRPAISLTFLKVAAIILFVLNLSLLIPSGIIDFNEDMNSSNLNDEYFADYSLSAEQFTLSNENEKQ